MIKVTAITDGGAFITPAFTAVTETLTELGLTIAVADISNLETKPSSEMRVILEGIAKHTVDCRGVVIAYDAGLLAPSLSVQAFLNAVWRNNGLRELPIMTIGASDFTDNALAASEYVTRVITKLGAYEAQRVVISPPFTNADMAETLKEIVQKQAEDYYRFIRQNRKYLIPDPQPSARAASAAELSEAEQAILAAAPTMEELLKKYGASTSTPDSDIAELTRLYGAKVNNVPNAPVTPREFLTTPAAQAPVTTLQQTKSMIHRYKPQFSNGLNAVFQLNITGAEHFDGYITVDGINARFDTGLHESPDLTIISDYKVWYEVLSGKHSAQKAFMVGSLKVRGNFVLLSRFDQLFGA